MSFKPLVSAIIAVIVGYYWLNYVKRGPVYESDKKLNGKTVLITGGNAGIGKATAMDLAKRGARVVIASRNLKKSNKVKDEIIKESGNHDIRTMQVDLSDYGSVRQFAKEFDESEKYLDYFVNNAGIVLDGMTKYGMNRLYVVDYFGPFLLTNLLLDKMKKQSAERPVRIINLTSEGYKFAEVYESSMRKDPQGWFEIFFVYWETNLANIQFIYNLNKELKDYDITTYSVNPGTLIHTEAVEELDFNTKVLMFIPQLLIMRDVYYGYQTSLYTLLDDSVTAHSGGFFTGCSHEKLWPHATNESAWELLKKKSLEVTGLSSI
ncbi:retinol dehydrogenase 12-like [Clavelina lepadiformis]|uniref:retinol dehydrogenase 12-like n=1 Tax=Clavelina lepadiformis TaxID=159417 RepID=UPI0040426425